MAAIIEARGVSKKFRQHRRFPGFIGALRTLFTAEYIEVDAVSDVSFADPYAAWQSGTNENSNGLLRQYLPKGIDMKSVSDAQLASAVNSINHRPRKCLAYKTPHEVLSANIAGAFG